MKILQAACEIVGGNQALAERLGIGCHVLAMFTEGRRQLPDSLLLQVVDIILEDRQTRISVAGEPTSQARRPPSA
jgi:hypothetical protein